jgi:hypothetical protein
MLTIIHTGTYDNCIGFCHPTWGWAPKTEVKITYFPYGTFGAPRSLTLGPRQACLRSCAESLLTPTPTRPELERWLHLLRLHLLPH